MPTLTPAQKADVEAADSGIGHQSEGRDTSARSVEPAAAAAYPLLA